MGRVKEPENVDVLEFGNEPEYGVTHIHRYDIMQNGMVRLYLAAHRGPNRDRIEFTALCSAEDLITMSQQSMKIATEAINAKAINGAPAKKLN